MPKRPRSHVLETESQRAFASALPSDLVVREISDDYGIDREVEVFVEGQTTGLTFKVQLKATDKSGTTTRVKQASLDYWMSLDIPVLLVTYEAGTKRLRGRWVHSIGADGPPSGATTVTVSMDASIDIQETWAARLANDLTLIRAVRRGDIPKPTPIRLTVDPELPLSQPQTAAALLKLGRRTGWPMRAPLDHNEAAVGVTFEAVRAQASLPLQLGTCTLHAAEAWPPLTPQTSADLALMLAAGAVGTVNEQCAREWILKVGPDSPWWSIPGLTERLWPLLNHPDATTLMHDIHANMFERGDPEADLFFVGGMDQAVAMTSDAFDAYSDRIRANLAPGWDGGLQAFNLSGAHRLRREYPTALELLDLAVERAPDYQDDPLFNRYRGACLWELGRFDESAETYRRGLACGFDSHEMLPLLADSLLYAGRYAEAREVLSSWEPIGAASDKAGYIRVIMLDHVLSFTGVQRQDRRGFEEDEAARRYRVAREGAILDEEMIRDLLRDSDALHPRLWIHLIGADDGTVRFEPALITAFMLIREPTCWVLALVGALDAGAEEPVIRAVVDQARFLCKDDFYDAVLEFAEHQDDEHAEYLRELISAAYTADPETFTHRVRALRPGHVAWAVDIAQYPSVYPSP